MPRGRFLSNKISLDPKFNSLTDSEALFYSMLIAHLDREGRFYGEAHVIKYMVCPLRTWDYNQITTMLENISGIKKSNGHGLLDLYHHKGVRYLYMDGFPSEQVGMEKWKESPSVIPPPPAHQKKTSKKPAKNKGEENVLNEIVDEQIAKIFKDYEEQTGRPLTPMQAEILKSLIDEYGAKQVSDTLAEVKEKRGIRNPAKYIQVMLDERNRVEPPVKVLSEKEKLAGFKIDDSEEENELDENM